MDRRIVELEVAGMHDRSGTAANGQTDAVGNRVGNAEELYLKRTESKAFAWLGRLEHCAVQEMVLGQFGLDQTAGQTRRVERRACGYDVLQ